MGVAQACRRHSRYNRTDQVECLCMVLLDRNK